MTTESTMSHRWKAKGVLALLMCSLLFCWKASGQAVPQVTSSVSTGLTHPTGWGNLTGSVITTNGDFIVQDFSYGGLYEFPADGSAMITLLAPGSLGGYQDPGLAIDSNNTLYLEGNWANCVLSFAYNPTTKTWPDLANVNTAVSPNNATQNCPSQFTYLGNSYPYQYWPADLTARYAQPKGMTTDSNNDLIVGTYDSGDSWIGLFPMVVTNGVAAPGPIQVLLQNASGYTMSIAVDKWGNTYFTENQSANSDFAHPLPGVLMIPAGAMDLQTDTGLTRVDPNLPDVTAVTSDPEGNLYVADGVKGVIMIPAATSAKTLPQTANSVVLTTDAAQGNVAIDWPRQILYVPTTTTQSNGLSDVAKVGLGKGDLGSTAVATATAPTPISYLFSGSVTPSNFIIEEGGGAADFAIATGGTCASGTAYAQGSACTVNVTASPNSAGSVSAKLLMLDSASNLVASTSLHSIGLGPALSISPAIESAVGSGLKTPSQVAVDANGNTYVADAGLGKVLMYPKGSFSFTAGVPVGTGLTAPTGVAVDGAGDVFIADSGNVIEVPYGPLAAGAAKQPILRSGLGSNLQLAADGFGNVYVTDPANARVVKLIQPGAMSMLTPVSIDIPTPEIDFTGFTAPSAIAVDASDHVYVLDNQNLLELQDATSTPATLISSLGAASSLAFDPSGALYATLSGGTMRIPNISGVLTQSAETPVATSVTAPTGIAIDKSGNAYIADSGAGDLHFVGVNGSLSFLTLASASTLNASLLNIGNMPLTVAGFTSSDTDFSVIGCASAVAAGSMCDATATLTPPLGVQVALSSTITVNGNQTNAPAVIDATGTGDTLSQVTISVANSANVYSVPVTVTVASPGGGATPTGMVIIKVDGLNPTNFPLSGGSASIALTAVPAGSHTFTVEYVGDPTYRSSNALTTATVAKGTVTLSVPSFPSYVVSTSANELPYDSSLNSYLTSYVVTVSSQAGLLATGMVSFNAANSSCVSWPMGVPAADQATFNPGCLPITTNSTSPNEITPQTITSIVYSGDANYLPATATTTTAGGPLTFNEVRQPSVSISPNPGSLTLSNGTGSTQLSISSIFGYGVSTNSTYPSSTPTLQLNNYTLPVNFACQGLPAYSACTFTGGNYTDINGVLHSDEFVIDTDPSKPVSVTVTIHSNISTTASKQTPRSPIAFAMLFGFGLIGFAARRRIKDARFLTLCCVLTLAGATLGLTSCSSNTFAAESSTPVTPSGAYPVTIVAQQVGSIVVTGSNGPVTVYGSLNQVSLPYTLKVTVQ